MAVCSGTKGLRCLASQTERELAEDAHRARDADVAALALNGAVRRAVAVFGCRECGHERGIVQQQCAAGVHSVEAAVAHVIDRARRAKESDGEAQVVDVQVHQRSAGTRRVEGWRQFALQVAVVAAAVLRVAAVHHADGAQLPHGLGELRVERHVEQAESGHTEHAILHGGIVERLGLLACDGERLFHDDVSPGAHGLERVGVVHVIGIGDVDKVGLRLGKHAGVVGEDETRGCVLHAEVYGVLHALLAGVDARHLDAARKLALQHLHHFLGYLSGSGYGEFHSLTVCFVGFSPQI